VAQTVKSYGESIKASIGGRYLTITEITLGTEYKTEGIEVNPEKLGLTDGLIDAAWCCNVAGLAKAAKALIPSIVVSGGPPASKMKLQLYEAGKEKEFLPEEAEKGEVGKEMKVVICAIGR
jgi:hypothetical protein